MSHARRHARRAVLVGVLAALALSATGVAQAGGVRSGSAAKVTVTITDRSLRVTPGNPSSGQTTFVVRNTGKRQHVLAITGPGVKGVRTGKVAGGRSVTLTVKLRPGVYVLSDPVGLGAYTSAFLSVVRAAVLTDPARPCFHAARAVQHLERARATPGHGSIDSTGASVPNATSAPVAVSVASG